MNVNRPTLEPRIAHPHSTVVVGGGARQVVLRFRLPLSTPPARRAPPLTILSVLYSHVV